MLLVPITSHRIRIFGCSFIPFADILIILVVDLFVVDKLMRLQADEFHYGMASTCIAACKSPRPPLRGRGE